MSARHSARCGSGGSLTGHDDVHHSGERHRPYRRVLHSDPVYPPGCSCGLPGIQRHWQLIEHGVDQRTGVLLDRFCQLGIEHRCLDARVPEQLLYLAQTQAALEKMRGIGVPKRVSGHVGPNTGIGGDLLDRALHTAFAHGLIGPEAFTRSVASREE